MRPSKYVARCVVDGDSAVVWSEYGAYVASTINDDVMAQGRTVAEAVQRLAGAVRDEKALRRTYGGQAEAAPVEFAFAWDGAPELPEMMMLAAGLLA